jgi:hypothetical protein
MPTKPHSSDWDYHFGRTARRRRGPIALFVTMTLVLAFLSIMAVGASFGAGRYREYTAAQSLTATPLWEKYYADQTATAAAKNGQAAPAAQSTTNVLKVGNMRSEPRVAPETVIGQVAAGDVATVLETRTVENSVWYRVRINGSGQEGWISSILVAPVP